MFPFLNSIDQTTIDFFFFEWYKEYNRCLISLSFSELFSAFNCARVIGNLLSIWSGVSIFSPCPFWFSSSNFSLLIFVLSAMLSSNSGFSSETESSG